MKRYGGFWRGSQCGRGGAISSLERLVREQRGQGTTEYAILVGVLVVIAIFAIVAFRGRVQELWDAIVDGMGQL